MTATFGNNETHGNTTDQRQKLSVPSVISVCSVISLPLDSMPLPLQGEDHFNFDFVHPILFRNYQIAAITLLNLPESDASAALSRYRRCHSSSISRPHKWRALLRRPR